MTKGGNFVGGFEEEDEPTTVEERAIAILTGLLAPLVGEDLEEIRHIADDMIELDDDENNGGAAIGEMLLRACTILEEFQKIEEE
jgi:hypothetical protein